MKISCVTECKVPKLKAPERINPLKEHEKDSEINLGFAVSKSEAGRRFAKAGEIS